MRRNFRCEATLAGIALTTLLFASSAAGFAPIDSSFPPTRLAYLDPGSGSFVVQALIAMFAGIVVTCRMYWTKIKSFFGVASDPTDDDDDDEHDDDRPADV